MWSSNCVVAQRWASEVKDTIAAFKKRFSLQHLSHNAAHRPNVH